MKGFAGRERSRKGREELPSPAQPASPPRGHCPHTSPPRTRCPQPQPTTAAPRCQSPALRFLATCSHCSLLPGPAPAWMPHLLSFVIVLSGALAPGSLPPERWLSGRDATARSIPAAQHTIQSGAAEKEVFCLWGPGGSGSNLLPACQHQGPVDPQQEPQSHFLSERVPDSQCRA